MPSLRIKIGLEIRDKILTDSYIDLHCIYLQYAQTHQFKYSFFFIFRAGYKIHCLQCRTLWIQSLNLEDPDDGHRTISVSFLMNLTTEEPYGRHLWCDKLTRLKQLSHACLQDQTLQIFHPRKSFRAKDAWCQN